MRHLLPLHVFLLLVLFGHCHPSVAQPTLTSLAPASNARNVARTAAVTATFSQPVSPGSTQGLMLYSAQRGGLRTAHSGSTVVNGNALVFTPTYAWQPGETVTAIVTRTAQNAGGQALAKPRVSQFTTQVGGAGQGNFQPGTEVGVGVNCDDVAVGDVDGDGDLDLLAVDSYSRAVNVRLNGGDASGSNSGVFSGSQNVAVDYGNPRGIAVGDVDGDGDLDFVTANGYQGYVNVRLNGGNNSGSNTGRFSNGTNLFLGIATELTSLALADVDGDGDLDLLVANEYLGRVYVRLNGGDASGSNTGVFSGAHFVDLGFRLESFAVGDVDGDGDLDLVAANAVNIGTVSIGLNGGDNSGSNTGTYSRSQTVPVGDLPKSMALGDVDNDGDLDFVAANGNSGTVSVRLNGGDASGSNTGVFSGSQEVVVSDNPYSVALGDVDGDGDLDLLAGDVRQPYVDYRNNTVRVLLNGGDNAGTSTGTFSNGFATTVGANPRHLVLSDVDGDGDVDLLSANNIGSYSVSVRLNTVGGGTLTSTTSMVCAGSNTGTLILKGFPGTILNYQADSGTGYQDVPGTTATRPFFDLTTTTTFRAVVRTPYNQIVYSAPVTVTVNPTPTASLLANGPTTFCQGASVALDASGGAPGSSYQFYKNGLAIPGAVFSRYAAQSSGNYSVRVTNPTGCGSVSSTLAILVNPLTTAAFAYSGTAYCQSGANPSPVVTGTSGGTFTSTPGLSLNATTGTIALASSTPGSYVVTYLVGGPCPSSGTASVTVTPAPVAIFSYPNAAYCTSEPAALLPAVAGNASAGTFTSTPGLTLNASTGAITPGTSQPGTYLVTNTLAASGGCAATSATASVTIYAVPPTPTVSVAYTGTTTTFTSSASTGNQWYRNGTAIPGATDQTYVVSATAQYGTYTVVTTSAPGCASPPSAPAVVTSSPQALAGARLSVYPNPSSNGRFSVALEGYSQPVELVVFNPLGQVLSRLQVPSGIKERTLDLGALPAGVYVLRASTAAGSASRSLIKL